MAPRKIRLALLLAAALALVFAAPASASIISPRAAHSPNAEGIRTAYWVALVVAAVLVVAVNAALIVAVMRFREGRGRRPTQITAGRGFFLRAGIPLAAVAAGVFVFGIVKTSDVRDVTGAESGSASASSALTAQVGLSGVPPLSQLQGQATATGQQPISSSGTIASPLEINAVGQQWLWRFEYPSPGQTGPPYAVFSYNELVVPVNTTVILSTTSTDVTHRYFVPALGGQVDAVPGEVSQTWFRADHEGTYPGQSTSFSGTSYAVMRIWVKVVSPQAYQAFISGKQREIKRAQTFVQKKIDQQATVGGVKLP